MSSGRFTVKNIATAQGRTTVKLEDEFWDALSGISQREELSINAVFREIDVTRGEVGRTSACCVYILQYFRKAANEIGHAAAGHGPISGYSGTFLHPNNSSSPDGQLSFSRSTVRNIASARGRTTVKLEDEFWNSLREISRREGLSINAVFREIDVTRGEVGRSSACCVYILQYFRMAANEPDHAAAGQGTISGYSTTPVHPNRNTVQKVRLTDDAAGVFGARGATTEATPAVDVKAFHAKIGELLLENDFLAGTLSKAGLLSRRR